MAFAEKYFIQHLNTVGGTTTTTRIELHEDNFVGSVTELKGRGDFWVHEYENLDPVDIFKEPVQKSRLEMHINLSDATDLSILEDIFAADEGDYRLIKRVNGTVVWRGAVINDMLEYSEGGYPKHGVIIAKDLSYLEGLDYSFATGYETIITTLAGILSQAGYDLDIHTYTSWKEDNQVDATDDFLNEVTNDVFGLRQYARTGDESDEKITVFKALKEVCRNYGLILRQAGGAWRLYHRSALGDPTAVDEYIYNSAGTQTAKNTGASQVDISIEADRIVRYVLPNSKNKFNKGLKSVRVKYEHRTAVTNIQFPDKVETDGVTTISQTFSQLFISDGDQIINLSTRATADHGAAPENALGRVQIKAGSYWWDEDARDWVGVNTVNTFSLAIYTLQKSRGFVSIQTDPTPADADGTLEVTFLNAIDDNGAADSTIYDEIAFSIDNQVGEENSTSIDYLLTQTGDYSGRLDYGKIWYGDGPTGFSRGALKVGSAFTADSWKRKGEVTSVNHAQLLLRECLDNQRVVTKNGRFELYGEYEADKVLEHKTEYFFFLGGAQTGRTSRWDADFVEINIQTGSDTFEDLPKFAEEGSSGTSSSGGGSSSGIDQTTADARYFKQSSNLSEGTASTIRDNIELGEADSPTFDGLNIGSEWLLDTESFSSVNRLSIRAQSGNEDMELFLHPIGNATHARLEVSNDPNLNNYNSIAIESNETSQRIVSRAQGSATILPLQIRVAGDETLSLWTNDVQRLSVGSSSATLTVPLSGTSATLTGALGVTGIITGGASLSNELLDSERNLLIRNTNARLQIASTEQGSWASSVILSNIVAENDTQVWVMAQASDANGGSLAFGYFNPTTDEYNSSASASKFLRLQADGNVDIVSGDLRISTTTVIDSNRDGFLRNLEVSGGLFVSEFVVNQTRVLFDHAISQGGGKVSTVTGSAGSEVITFEDADGAEFVPLEVDDIIHIQQRTGVSSGTIVKNIWRKVASIASNDITLTTTGIDWTTGEDVGSIAVGDNVVQKGNTTDADRQSYVEMLIGGLDVPQNKVWSGVDDVGGGSEVIRVWGLDGFGATGDRGIAGKVGGSLAFEVSETRGMIGGLIFSDQELRNSDDTFSFSTNGIKLTSTSSFSSPDEASEIRWNTSSGRIGYDNFSAELYNAAPRVILRSTVSSGGGVELIGRSSNPATVSVGLGIEIDPNTGSVTIPNLPTTQPSTANTLWRDTADSNRLKVTDPPGVAPSAPTGLDSERSRANNALYVFWNSVADADTYTLERQTGGGGYTAITTTSDLFYYDSVPFNNKSTSYDFRVKATNSSGDSSYSTVHSESWNAAPNKESLNPTNVSFVFLGSGNDALTWTVPQAGAPSSYLIQYAVDTGGGFGSWTVLESAYTGSSPYNFNACNLGDNTDDIKLRLTANYSNPTESSSNVESNAETLSGCF